MTESESKRKHTREEQFLEILKISGKLKTAVRHNWTAADRKESVADHSWRMALMAMLLSEESEFQNIDMNRVIRMCLIHDLGEAFTGDIPTFEKTEEDDQTEDQIFHKWVDEFPEPQRSEWINLLLEMKERSTIEAKLYKALDKLEAVISHDEAGADTWLPLEYSLQFTYASGHTSFSPYLENVRRLVDQWTESIIDER